MKLTRIIPTATAKPETGNQKPMASSLIENGFLSLFHRRYSCSTLDYTKFSRLMSNFSIISDFEPTFSSFEKIRTVSASILGAHHCFIFLIDEKQHEFYCWMKNDKGMEIKITKPINDDIIAFVMTKQKVLNMSEFSDATHWYCSDFENYLHRHSGSYLALPILDVKSGKCLGIIEFHKKIDSKVFNIADEQIAQILAHQIGIAVILHYQKKLLDGQKKAIKLAYDISSDQNDSIEINNDESGMECKRSRDRNSQSDVSSDSRQLQEDDRNIRIKQRSAMAVGSSWTWKPLLNHPALLDRDWSYDVFVYGEEELTSHAVDIFDERGLFTTFSIPLMTFVNFVNEVKAGYNSGAPYHNHYHAFDVMHVCYLLLTRCKADGYLDSFNILSILVAALAHDLGHDGFNNSFHCTTNSELAVMYNGISILENYSAAYLFRILRKEKCNIFAQLQVENMNKMRSRLIGLILDTDAKNHFMIMNRFRHSMEIKQLSRGLLSSMILHVADVSNPIRPGVIARKWAYAVQEEFFRQGDKEKQLKMEISPFMDRSFENLPRMQRAFIDAIVTPIFKLLSELLPLVEEQCIQQLNINRSFWSSMQNQNVITTENIIAFLKGYSQENVEAISSTPEELEDTTSYSPRMARNSTSVTVELAVGAIPGIPENAMDDEKDERPRKQSLVLFQSNKYYSDTCDDPEKGIIMGGSYMASQDLILHSTKTRTRLLQCLSHSSCFEKGCLTTILYSGTTQMVLLTTTVFALLANDLNIILGRKITEFGIDIALLVVLVIFIMEIILSIFCVSDYLQFFFWFDMAALISLSLEIDLILDSTATLHGEEFALAKASRAAKIGARAGRLAKLLRLLKLLKATRVLKWIMLGSRNHKSMKWKDDEQDEIGMKMSVVGRKMTESITKKEIDQVPDGRQLQLDALAIHPDSKILRDGMFRAHKNILELVGIGAHFVDLDRIKKLTATEILRLSAKSNENAVASFDISNDVYVNAVLSLTTTITVTTLLALFSLLLSSDAYKIMIHPIEKMKSTIEKLSENPLLHLEKIKQKNKQISSESSETDLLERTITKMAMLLQVGFGCAGTEIIAKSLSIEGELDPMVPGCRVTAIFGFCDIRNFILATELLQQDVMLFVNKLAHITHSHVVASGGAPNKNIGDAFLLVWKLDCSKHGHNAKIPTHVFDAALSSIQNVISEIKQLGTLADFMQESCTSHEEKNTNAFELKNFCIEMGFGLHTGWAIEGSIGSKIKVDATYLSPHVNVASRLEGATKLYNLPLLMSDEYISGLSSSIQSTCRRVDKVVFKGCCTPMIIFHHDIVPYSMLNNKPVNYSELMLATTWDGKDEIEGIGINIHDVINALHSNKAGRIQEVYECAFNAYIGGQWEKCKIIFHLWMEKFPGDIVVQNLVNIMIPYQFKCPTMMNNSSKSPDGGWCHVLERK